jgi:hypothetical protein
VVTSELIRQLRTESQHQQELQFSALTLARKLLDTSLRAQPRHGREICGAVLRWVAAAEQRFALLRAPDALSRDFFACSKRLRTDALRRYRALELALGYEAETEIAAAMQRLESHGSQRRTPERRRLGYSD